MSASLSFSLSPPLSLSVIRFILDNIQTPVSQNPDTDSNNGSTPVFTPGGTRMLLCSPGEKDSVTGSTTSKAFSLQLSMAEFFLAMGVWFDNWQEQPEQLQRSSVTAPDANTATDGASEVDGTGRAGEVPETGEATDKSQPWPAFGTREFHDRWMEAATKWGFSFAVYFPVMELRMFMETSYFPTTPNAVTTGVRAPGAVTPRMRDNTTVGGKRGWMTRLLCLHDGRITTLETETENYTLAA